MKSANSLSVRGCDVARMLKMLRDGSIKVEGYKYIVLLVGSNDFGSKSQWLKFKAYKEGIISYSNYQAYLGICAQSREISIQEFTEIYRDIILHLKSLHSSTTVMCSAILPLPWDHDRRDVTRRMFNGAIHQLAASLNCPFLSAYTPFYLGYGLRDAYFKLDGLHLSDKGASALMSFFSDKIYKAKHNLIY